MASEQFLDIEIAGDPVLEKLDRMVSRLRSPEPALQEIGELVKASIVRNFEVGGRYRAPGDWRGGERRWRPLSVLTLFGSLLNRKGKFLKKDGSLNARGRKKLSGKKILIREGHLMNSINWQAGLDFVGWGSNLIYAAIHNFGGQAGRNKSTTIPARPYFVLQTEDLEQINDVMDDFLTGGF